MSEIASELIPKNNQSSVNAANNANSINDELSLIDLFEKLWERKWAIVISSILCGLIGASWGWIKTPTYQADLSIVPPNESEILGINNSNIIIISNTKAYLKMISRVSSFENFVKYHKQHESWFNTGNAESALMLKQQAKVIFDNWFRFEKTEPIENSIRENDHFKISIEYPKGIIGHDIINQYLEWTQTEELTTIKNQIEKIKVNEINNNIRKMDNLLIQYQRDTNAEIDRLEEEDAFGIKELSDQLITLKNKLSKENRNRIFILNENIAIAKKLGIKKPSSPSDLKEIKPTIRQPEVIKAEFSSLEKLPLYFRGFESLEAEKSELLNRTKETTPSKRIIDLERQIELLSSNRTIEKLKNRKNPEIFIDSYIQLEKKNQELSSYQLDISNVKLFQIEQAALPPAGPIKPKKLFILIISIILGGLIGVMHALLMAAKDRNSNKAI